MKRNPRFHANTVKDYWPERAGATSFLRYERNNTNSADDNQASDEPCLIARKHFFYFS